MSESVLQRCSCGVAVEGHQCDRISDPEMLDLMRQLQEQMDSGELRFPVLEEVATKLLWLVSRHSSTGLEIAEVVDLDPNLAERLVRLSNSGLFGGKFPISGTARAATRLGVEAVAALTVGSASCEAFRSQDPRYHALLRACWKKSVFAASAGELLAPYANVDPELGHLAGLMHAIGEPVLVMSAEQLIAEGRAQRPPAAELYAVIDPLTPQAAMLLVERWNLPTELSHALHWYRSPETSIPEEHRLLSALIRVAASTSCHCICGHEERALPELEQADSVLVIPQGKLNLIAKQACLNGERLLAVYDGENPQKQDYESMCCPLGTRLCAKCGSESESGCGETKLLEIDSDH